MRYRIGQKIDTGDALTVKAVEVAGYELNAAVDNIATVKGKAKVATANAKSCPRIDCEYHDQVSAGGTPCSNCRELVKGSYYTKA